MDTRGSGVFENRGLGFWIRAETRRFVLVLVRAGSRSQRKMEEEIRILAGVWIDVCNLWIGHVVTVALW